MKNTKQTELIEKLATLPIWDAALRRQLHADFAKYVPLVSSLIRPHEREALAVDLPAKWNPQRPSAPDVQKLVRTDTWLIMQSFSCLHMVALFLILMDERERHANSVAATALTAPQAKSPPPAELDDEMPF